MVTCYYPEHVKMVWMLLELVRGLERVREHKREQGQVTLQ